VSGGLCPRTQNRPLSYRHMKNIVLNYLRDLKNKSFNIDELLKRIQTKHANFYDTSGGYSAFYETIEGLVSDGYLTPVKASGRYFMTPPLFNRYRTTDLLHGKVISKEKTEELINEIMCLNPKLDKHYYLEHLDKYLDDRKRVNELNNWLNRQDSTLTLPRNTVNERSFEIFNNEKYLGNKGQKMILNLKLMLEDLNCYKTYEAFFYMLFDSRGKGNALIIENKDSFMSLLYYFQKQTKPSLCNFPISMLIYGEGKKIIKSFTFMDELKRQIDIDTFYYWGDLDYTGIEILQTLMKTYPQYKIIPLVGLYKQMLECAKNPPLLRTGQNKVFIEEFICFFDEETSDRIKKIINNGRYIPQEAVRFG